MSGKYIKIKRVNIKHQKVIYKWLLEQSYSHLWRISLLMGIDILLTFVEVGITLVYKKIIDEATAGGIVLQNVVHYILFIVIAIILGAFCNYFEVIIFEKLCAKMQRKIYNSIFNSFLGDITKYHTGDMMTRLTQDAKDVAFGIIETIPSILVLVVKIMTAFGVIYYFDPFFALLVIILMPIGALIGLLFTRKVKQIYSEEKKAESTYRSYLQESLSNIVVIKSFCAHGQVDHKLMELKENKIKHSIHYQKMSSLTTLIMNTVYYIGFVSVLIWSSIKISTQSITYGTMTVFISMFDKLQSPIKSFIVVWPKIISILTSAERLMELDCMKKETYTTDTSIPKQLGVTIDNLSFRYSEAPILNQISVEIKAGEFIAMIGKSGIGKTTLIRLIMALYEPNAGDISFMNEYGERMECNASMRSYISYVPQGNTLVSGTLRENLMLGKCNATEEDIWNALEIVAAKQFVNETADGLDSLIGEKGIGLSEGQAQRIAIARALLKNAPLLIMDEATSALDSDTEFLVLQNLIKLKPKVTCIIVTHRASILKICDSELRIIDGALYKTPIQH